MYIIYPILCTLVVITWAMFAIWTTMLNWESDFLYAIDDKLSWKHIDNNIARYGRSHIDVRVVIGKLHTPTGLITDQGIISFGTEVTVSEPTIIFLRPTFKNLKASMQSNFISMASIAIGSTATVVALFAREGRNPRKGMSLFTRG